MSDANVNLPGLNSNYSDNSTPNTGSDNRELYMELFSQEVLQAFMQNQVAMERISVKQISGAKSYRWPATGRLDAAEVHTPGSEILGQEVLHSERVISVDQQLVASVFTDSVDDALVAYDERSIMAYQAGQTLANTADQFALQSMSLAAEAPATVQGLDGGSVLGFTDAGAIAGNMDLVLDAIFAGLREMDQKFVPGTDRNIFVDSLVYYSLMRDPTVAIGQQQYQNAKSPIAAFMSRDTGGTGDLNSAGGMPRIGGAALIKTQNLLRQNITGTPGGKYDVDNTNTVALLNTPQAVGAVKLIGLTTDSTWDPRRLGWLTVARMALGMGVLRPECAVLISDAGGESLTPETGTAGNRPGDSGGA